MVPELFRKNVPGSYEVLKNATIGIAGCGGLGSNAAVALVRGGIVVDYAVWRPMLTGFEYFGEYWHSGQMGADDKLKLIAEEQYFHQPTIVAFGDDITSQETSDEFVRKNVL